MWVSHLVGGVLDVGAVPPLGQDDGLHRFPVQTATLWNIAGRLRRRVVVLEGGHREKGLRQYTDPDHKFTRFKSGKCLFQ